MSGIKEIEKLTIEMNKYIEFGKLQKLIPESVCILDEFLACKNHANVIIQYIERNYGKND